MHLKSFVYLSIFTVLIFTLSAFTIQDAHATPTFLSNSSACVSIAGTWSGTKTCTVSSLIIHSGDTLMINHGIVLVNAGTITVNSGGTININDGGTIINNPGGTINNRGTIYNAPRGTINNSGTINNNPGGTFTNASTFINQCGAVYTGLYIGTPSTNILCIVDTDKDGIPDNLDKCPKEAETINDYQDTDGCPDKVPTTGLKESNKIPDLKISDATTTAPHPTTSVPTLSIADLRQSEGNVNGGFKFTVTLSAPSTTPVTFTAYTKSGTATTSDYIPLPSTTITIPAGSTSATVNVTVLGDTISEPDETFTVTLTNPVGATIPGTTVNGTILNDDATTTTTVTDTDKDGIPDNLDKCPREAETINGYLDTDGCPDVSPTTVTDTDKDGIPDNLDKCPREAETINGYLDTDGCPDVSPTTVTDTDKDGIPDNLDKCPREAETINGYLDTDGCPDTIPSDTPPSDSSSGTPQCQEGYYYDYSKQACVPNRSAAG